MLETSIQRYPDIDVKVSAILNDTTGCLIACAYKRHDCAIGVIIGTGTNASYVEDLRNVELYQGPKGTKKDVVINTEWGALGNTGSLDFIRTKYDHSVDQNSKNCGKQVYEKLIRLESIECIKVRISIIFLFIQWDVSWRTDKIHFSGCSTEKFVIQWL